MTDEELKAIEARVNAATAAPWCTASIPWQVWFDGGYGKVCRIESKAEDRDFIANARQDVPALLEEVRRLNRLVGELQKKLVDEERAHEQTITDRDTFEESLTDLAADAGCEKEWSNLHAHGHCITDLWVAKVDDVLRWAHTMLCPQSSQFRDGDCICDETFKRHKTEKRNDEVERCKRPGCGKNREAHLNPRIDYITCGDFLDE